MRGAMQGSERRVTTRFARQQGAPHNSSKGGFPTGWRRGQIQIQDAAAARPQLLGKPPHGGSSRTGDASAAPVRGRKQGASQHLSGSDVVFHAAPAPSLPPPLPPRSWAPAAPSAFSHTLASVVAGMPPHYINSHLPAPSPLPCPLLLSPTCCPCLHSPHPLSPVSPLLLVPSGAGLLRHPPPRPSPWPAWWQGCRPTT